jgi:Beta-ketoacyl synthase, N-terminal domain
MSIILPIHGVGLRAPGIASAQDLLSDPNYELPIERQETQPKGLAPGLPPAERRRATAVTRLALDAAMEASGDVPLSNLTPLFTSSGGEVDIVHQIFDMLAMGDTALSPTAFHNSVHNAAAGYFGIASGSMQPSDSLCAFNDSVGAGLSEAALRFASGDRNLLLTAYDLPVPWPIVEYRPIQNGIAGTLLLGHESAPIIGNLFIDLMTGPTKSHSTGFFALPSAPLKHPAHPLVAIIRAVVLKKPTRLTLNAGFGGQLTVEVQPC